MCWDKLCGHLGGLYALGHLSAKMGVFSKLVDRGHLVATDGTTR